MVYMGMRYKDICYLLISFGLNLVVQPHVEEKAPVSPGAPRTYTHGSSKGRLRDYDEKVGFIGIISLL